MTQTTYIATFIAHPEKELDRSFTEMVLGTLRETGCTDDVIDWLSVHHACDIPFTGDNVKAKQALDEKLISAEIDWYIQPASESRRKKLLISDMDSTMIQQECIDELAAFIGKKEEVSEITEQAMNGELDFSQALRKRVSLLNGLSESALESAFKERITLMPGAKTLVATMKKHDASCILVSGGFTYFTSRVKEEVGFDADEANKLEIQNGQLTGQVIDPILDKESKLESLTRHAKHLDISHELVLAVGDGANDLPMIQAAGLGVAYHAKPTVREQSDVQVMHNDLSALLYLQGYHDYEIEQIK